MLSLVALPEKGASRKRKKRKGEVVPLFTGSSPSQLDYRDYLGLHRGRRDGNDDNNMAAPLPTNKGGGDDYPFGAAETVISRKKKKRQPTDKST